METFAKLFDSLMVFVYHCFDRMLNLGYMPATRLAAPSRSCVALALRAALA